MSGHHIIDDDGYEDAKAALAIIANLVTAPKVPTPLTRALVRQYEGRLPDIDSMAHFVAGWQARDAEPGGSQS